MSQQQIEWTATLLSEPRDHNERGEEIRDRHTITVRGTRQEAYEQAEQQVEAEGGGIVGALAPLAMIVCVYDCGQAYGGPEEGGWFYDHGTPSMDHLHLMRVFTDTEQAANYLEALRAECERMNAAEHRYKHSARNTGWYDAFASQNAWPLAFPSTTPHYE